MTVIPLEIIEQDITEIPCDAIVNPTDRYFSGRGGIDLCVHSLAGEVLDSACKAKEPLQTGAVAVTDGYGLPCRYIIHTHGPVWHGGDRNEEILLRSCYLNALLCARRLDFTTLAFPLISSGTFGFPKDRVLRIAMDAISDFLFSVDSEPTVYICILDKNAYTLRTESALQEYLHPNKRSVCENQSPVMTDAVVLHNALSTARPLSATLSSATPQAVPPPPKDLAAWIHEQDDSFAVMLLKLIDKKGMTDVQCYKKANVTKGTFWKINNDPNYKPSKPTVLAFAIALELDITETEMLLKSVGFSLSGSNTFDRIIRFYILNGNYDIFEINASLFQYDQSCLGTVSQ